MIDTLKVMLRYRNPTFKISRYFHKSPFRNLKRWFPDAEYNAQFDGPVMYPDEVTSKFHVNLFPNMRKPQSQFMTVKTMTINFGPQHPAAHGVLRLLLELEGEVSVWRFLLILLLNHF